MFNSHSAAMPHSDQFRPKLNYVNPYQQYIQHLLRKIDMWYAIIKSVVSKHPAISNLYPKTMIFRGRPWLTMIGSNAKDNISKWTLGWYVCSQCRRAKSPHFHFIKDTPYVSDKLTMRLLSAISITTQHQLHCVSKKVHPFCFHNN